MINVEDIILDLIIKMIQIHEPLTASGVPILEKYLTKGLNQRKRFGTERNNIFITIIHYKTTRKHLGLVIGKVLCVEMDIELKARERKFTVNRYDIYFYKNPQNIQPCIK